MSACRLHRVVLLGGTQRNPDQAFDLTDISNVCDVEMLDPFAVTVTICFSTTVAVGEATSTKSLLESPARIVSLSTRTPLGRLEKVMWMGSAKPVRSMWIATFLDSPCDIDWSDGSESANRVPAVLAADEPPRQLIVAARSAMQERAIGMCKCLMMLLLKWVIGEAIRLPVQADTEVGRLAAAD
jgi:hypothetical protein